MKNYTYFLISNKRLTKGLLCIHFLVSVFNVLLLFTCTKNCDISCIHLPTPATYSLCQLFLQQKVRNGNRQCQEEKTSILSSGTFLLWTIFQTNSAYNSQIIYYTYFAYVYNKTHLK